MAVDPMQLPISLTFAGITGDSSLPPSPPVLPAAAAVPLRAFFEAHPSVAYLQFEIALTENGDDLEFAGGTLHGDDGAPVTGRDARRAGDALGRLLRTDPDLAALPVALVVAMEGIEHTFRITRKSTGAPPPPGEPADADEHAATRERQRLAEREARFEGRDPIRDDDHGA